MIWLKYMLENKQYATAKERVSAGMYPPRPIAGCAPTGGHVVDGV
jgi:hypothetical protein